MSKIANKIKEKTGYRVRHNTDADFSMRKQLFLQEERYLESKGRLKVIRGEDFERYLAQNNYRVPNGCMLKLVWNEKADKTIKMDFKQLSGLCDLSNIDFGGASVDLHGITKNDKVRVNHCFGIKDLTLDACSVKNKHTLRMGDLDIEGSFNINGGNYENIGLGFYRNTIAIGKDLKVNGGTIKSSTLERFIVKNKTYIMKGSTITDNKIINSMLGELDGEKKNALDFLSKNKFEQAYVSNLDNFLKQCRSLGLDEQTIKNVEGKIRAKEIQTGKDYEIHTPLGQELVNNCAKKLDAITTEKNEIANTPKEKDNANDLLLEGKDEDLPEKMNDTGFHTVKGKGYKNDAEFKKVNNGMSVEGVIKSIENLLQNSMLGIAKIEICNLNRDRQVRDRQDIKVKVFVDKNKEIEKEYRKAKAKENAIKHENNAHNEHSARERSDELIKK